MAKVSRRGKRVRFDGFIRNENYDYIMSVAESEDTSMARVVDTILSKARLEAEFKRKTSKSSVTPPPSQDFPIQ